MLDQVNVALSVDALTPKLTGIGRYCLELARGLPGSDGVGRVSFFRDTHWFSDPNVLLTEDWRPQSNRLRRFINNRIERWRARDAVVHGPNFFLPAWAEKGIINIHDLSVLRYPETHPVERVRAFEREFLHSVDRAVAILTSSSAVREEVISTLGIPSERVHTIPLGIRKIPINKDLNNEILYKFDLVFRNYTLCVSTFEPRKRIEKLVEAYSLLDPSLRREMPLVLVGASGWLNKELNDRIDVAQSAGWLKRLDYVSDQTRDALYWGARLFVYPSRYEGFGLPPLEAMQHGVPTIVGNADALIEIFGRAACVINVDDVVRFTQALADALLDDAWRRKASVASRAVARDYTWSSCLKRTISIYKKFSL